MSENDPGSERARARQEAAGLPYEAASRRGAALIERAAQDGKWFDLPEKLAALKAQMQKVTDV